MLCFNKMSIPCHFISIYIYRFWTILSFLLWRVTHVRILIRIFEFVSMDTGTTVAAQCILWRKCVSLDGAVCDGLLWKLTGARPGLMSLFQSKHTYTTARLAFCLILSWSVLTMQNCYFPQIWVQSYCFLEQIRFFWKEFIRKVNYITVTLTCFFFLVPF